MVGGFEKFLKSKVIYTAIVHSDQALDTKLSDFETRIILINEKTPKFPTDFELFLFACTFCDLKFITGNMARVSLRIHSQGHDQHLLSKPLQIA